MTAKVKQFIRNLFGDNIATSIHAIRFAYLNKANQLNFEKDMELLKKFPIKGKIVVDIGANSANWTTLLSRQVGIHGRVFAFEADPYYAAATLKTVKLLCLSNVLFFSIGLSDKAEILPLVVVDESGQRVSGTGKIVDGVVIPAISAVNVELQALDKFTETYPELLHTAVIKCDVEGFESRVFKGADKILNNARPIVVSEMNQDLPENTKEVFEIFKTLNYKSYVAVTENSIRLSDSPGEIPEGERPNRIFIPTEYQIPNTIHILQ